MPNTATWGENIKYFREQIQENAKLSEKVSRISIEVKKRSFGLQAAHAAQ